MVHSSCLASFLSLCLVLGGGLFQHPGLLNSINDIIVCFGSMLLLNTNVFLSCWFWGSLNQWKLVIRWICWFFGQSLGGTHTEVAEVLHCLTELQQWHWWLWLTEGFLRLASKLLGPFFILFSHTCPRCSKEMASFSLKFNFFLSDWCCFSVRLHPLSGFSWYYHPDPTFV